MNNEPNYILRLNETAFVPIKNGSVMVKLKPVIIGIMIVLIVGSFLLGDNLFSELGLAAKLTLIGLTIALFKIKTTEKQPSPLEIAFYDDRMVMFRNKIVRTKKVSRREYYTIKYNDISKCVLRTTAEKVCIHCTYEGVFYHYNSDGTVQATPNYNKTVKDGLFFFYYDFEKGRNFAKEIEAHAPLKFFIEET